MEKEKKRASVMMCVVLNNFRAENDVFIYNLSLIPPRTLLRFHSLRLCSLPKHAYVPRFKVG